MDVTPELLKPCNVLIAEVEFGEKQAMYLGGLASGTFTMSNALTGKYVLCLQVARVLRTYRREVLLCQIVSVPPNKLVV